MDQPSLRSFEGVNLDWKIHTTNVNNISWVTLSALFASDNKIKGSGNGTNRYLVRSLSDSDFLSWDEFRGLMVLEDFSSCFV